MKSRNYNFHGDAATVQRLKEEYEYLGRWVKLLDANHLVVLAYPPKKEKKKFEPRGKSQSAKREDRPKTSRS